MSSSILKTTKFRFPDRYFSPRKERPMADVLSHPELTKHLQSLGTPPAVPAEVNAVDICGAWAKIGPLLSWFTWIPTLGTWITYISALMAQFCPTAAARDAAYKGSKVA